MVSLAESIEIHQDIDYASGDIDFPGSLVIHGDINGEVSVKVGNNLDILGDAGDCSIEAGGNVSLSKGFLGRGSGVIQSGGTVKLQHILNQTVVARADVLLEREAVNSTIQAGKRLLAPSAQFTGGSLEAEELIEVGSIGRSEGAQAKIRVGKRGKILERIATIDKEIRQSEKNLGEIKDAVYKLVLMKINTKTLPPEREQLLNRLQQTQKQLPLAIESLKSEKSVLTEELSKNFDAKLKVNGTIHDNVFIDINGARKLTDSALSGVIFAERGGEITATGL
jgi:uncharacterized protein (DUF342 family)